MVTVRQEGESFPKTGWVGNNVKQGGSAPVRVTIGGSSRVFSAAYGMQGLVTGISANGKNYIVTLNGYPETGTIDVDDITFDEPANARKVTDADIADIIKEVESAGGSNCEGDSTLALTEKPTISSLYDPNATKQINVKGKLTSNYNLTYYLLGIQYPNGKWVPGLVISNKEKLTAKEFDLSTLNCKINFPNLPTGTYYYTVYASDEHYTEMQRLQYWEFKNEKVTALSMSTAGKSVLKKLELSKGYGDKYGLFGDGTYPDSIAVWPYWVGDKGITVGFGHWIGGGQDSLINELGLQGVPLDETTLDQYKNHKIADGPIKVTNAYPNVPIVSATKVASLFNNDVADREPAINDFCAGNNDGNVKILLTQNEFDALMIYKFKAGNLGQTIADLLKTKNRDRASWKAAFHSGDRGAKELAIFFNDAGCYN